MRHVLVLVAATTLALLATPANGGDIDLAKNGNDIPEAFDPNVEAFNYTRRAEMIPMRDGVKLFTVIITPKNVEGPMPIILTRTPYDADKRTKTIFSADAAMILDPSDEIYVRNGYIRVYQDVRGRYGSEGKYVMILPPRGPMNSGNIDHGTDTWDTIDWLVKNVKGNNGRVGIIGTSYDGFLTLMALFDPHPALKAAVPVNAMVEGWIGDDWYHNGALRQVMIEYMYDQTTSKDLKYKFPLGNSDTYSAFLEAGSAAAFGRRYKADQLPAWRRLIDNPAYTEYWKLQAVNDMLAAVPLKVPTMSVHALFDQEDIYGPILAYEALEAKDAANDKNYLVVGPWHHGQWRQDADHLGPFKWGSSTGLYFRTHVLLPFWEQFLKDIEPTEPIPPVFAFETGTNEWHRYQSWPADGNVKHQRLYFQPRGGLSFDQPPAAPGNEGHTDFVSDPAKPVPYRIRPIPFSDSENSTWKSWLVDDQRPFSDRPDVLVFTSDPLKKPLTVAGEVRPTLFAVTTGSDADWVVKLIDVYPPEVAGQSELGGYQLMVSADIMRGRYRESFADAKPIPAGKVLPYTFRIPQVDHTFLPGHRVMVQVQSSWFPLYDRNPQTFVDNIAYAEPGKYRKATHSIYHSGNKASFIELPVK